MPVERGKLEGPLEIGDQLQLDGMATGDVTVLSGGHLILRGICGRNLIIEKDGKVDLYGTVIGDVLNRGGVLEVMGTIRGHLETVESGDTHVSSGARVYGEGH